MGNCVVENLMLYYWFIIGFYWCIMVLLFYVLNYAFSVGSLLVEHINNINSIILVPPISVVISIFQISIKWFIWSQIFYASNHHVFNFATYSFWINDLAHFLWSKDLCRKFLVHNLFKFLSFHYSYATAVTQSGKCLMLIVCDVLFIVVSVV